MWWLAYVSYFLLYGLGWLSGISAALSLLLVFLLLGKGQSTGVTRNEQVFRAGAFIAFMLLLFLSVGAFATTTEIDHWLHRKVLEVAQQHAAECERLGDSKPLPPPSKVLVYYRGERILANPEMPDLTDRLIYLGTLRRDLQPRLGQETWVVIVGNTSRNTSRAREVVSVQIVRWPSGEALGQYFVRNDPPGLTGWINELPLRSQGDGREGAVAEDHGDTGVLNGGF